jgi:hypothetical protein
MEGAPKTPSGEGKLQELEVVDVGREIIDSLRNSLGADWVGPNMQRILAVFNEHGEEYVEGWGLGDEGKKAVIDAIRSKLAN